MASPALDIQGLTKRYGTTTAVDALDLQVGTGEFFGLLGPNGAGKTTTINCVTGIASLHTGTIRVCGHDVVREYRQARACTGLSPQEYDVDIFMTPRNILYYVAGFYGLTGDERQDRIQAVLERFGLTEHADKSFRHLSGGLKRRCILARALVHRPPVLILDEPTAGIDVELRRELWEHFRQINAAGTTIILTSHYLEEVEYLCERIAIMHRGRIAASGGRQELVGDAGSLEERYLQVTGAANAAAVTADAEAPTAV